MEIVQGISQGDYSRAENIVREYLPDTEPEKLRAMYAEFSRAFLGYYIDGLLIGLCYGAPADAARFTLSGIAIMHPYNAQGRGAKLIGKFEEAAFSLGYARISLGSGDGYVERFYMKNGYTAVALKILTERGDWKEKANGYAFPVASVETQGEYTKLVISVTDYCAMNKRAIQDYYGGVHSFFVFEKALL